MKVFIMIVFVTITILCLYISTHVEARSEALTAMFLAGWHAAFAFELMSGD